MSREQYLMDQFRSIAQRYEISDYFATKLKQLEGWEIVLICDDSGSMNTPVKQGTGAGGRPVNASPFAPSVTRWDELKNVVGIIVDLAAIFDKDGVDLYFLNRATLLHVTSSAQLQDVFAMPPSGLTPTTPVLQHVLKAKHDVMVEKKLLIVILTDGSPTNAQGNVDIPSLKRVLTEERNADRAYVTFVACTDDDSTVEYLNEWDRKIKHLDVVDDYFSEKAEIQKKKGRDFPFSVGNYVVKLLLGSIDPEFDSLDENTCCCNIL